MKKDGFKRRSSVEGRLGLMVQGPHSHSSFLFFLCLFPRSKIWTPSHCFFVFWLCGVMLQVGTKPEAQQVMEPLVSKAMAAMPQHDLCGKLWLLPLASLVRTPAHTSCGPSLITCTKTWENHEHALKQGRILVQFDIFGLTDRNSNTTALICQIHRFEKV